MQTLVTEVAAPDRIFRRKDQSMAAEFVTPGHPDKVCDQMADAIVDAAMSVNPRSRVATEVTGGHGLVVVIGEMSTDPDRKHRTPPTFDIGQVLKQVYKDIGHDHEIAVMSNVVVQSSDISQGVTETKEREQGAGDQGVMVGYAIADGSDFMPKTWSVARTLALRLRELRVNGTLKYLKPDGKTQVSMLDDRVVHVTIAAHHSEEISVDKVREDLISLAVHPMFPDLDRNQIVVNGTGRFVQGGFDADAGTTGRKLMIDNYGPNIEVGGGCYSGKDPSKVDRTAAYFCRMVAKSIVAGGHAKEAIVKVAFAIGVASPTHISVQTNLPEYQTSSLEQHIRKIFDFRPAAMIERLGLLQPVGWRYRDTAASGHYGDSRFPWEQVAEI